MIRCFGGILGSSICSRPVYVLSSNPARRAVEKFREPSSPGGTNKENTQRKVKYLE